MPSQKVWFITGSSSGFGRELVVQALANGDKVIATLRKPEVLSDFVAENPENLLALRLDVTRSEESTAAVQAGLDKFGRIDIVVNNAGYGLIGTIEEATDEQIQAQYDTNVFGVIKVLRAILPVFRKQKSGLIMNISSVAGFASFPSTGIYASTKFALEALSESLAYENAQFGVKVCIVEPGAFRTEFQKGSLRLAENRMPEYSETCDGFLEYIADLATNPSAGDPQKAAVEMIRVAHMDNPPLRLPLGVDAVTRMERKLAEVSANVAELRDRSTAMAYES
ncbi:MAG: SDR family NAD(P)-dependent oxidoreductase [Armatimonadetes bacterium]|nr:SDR family NAD(P)-dependent oxidoreductase [Armatimonadota bacterium]